MECVAQGVIETKHVEALKALLQGICGVNPENFRIHEICLKSDPRLEGSTEMRLLCDLDKTKPAWFLRQIGQQLRGARTEKLSVGIRRMSESKVSNKALPLFNALGYQMDYELLKEGFAFRTQRGAPIKVTVALVYKIPKLFAIDEAVLLTPGMHLVELTAPANMENYVEIDAAIKSFSGDLALLINLSKPHVLAGVPPTAAAAAAVLLSGDRNLRGTK